MQKELVTCLVNVHLGSDVSVGVLRMNPCRCVIPVRRREAHLIPMNIAASCAA